MIKKTKPTLRSLLKDLERDELLEVIEALCKFEKKNKQFVEVFIQGSDAIDHESVANEAKRKIQSKFFTPSGQPRTTFDLRSARKIISETSKLLKGSSFHIADIKLLYVEMGTNILQLYDDMYESFYSSLLSVFSSFCSDLTKNPELVERFADRLMELHKQTHWMGYGYDDEITDDIRTLFGNAGISFERS